MSKEDVNKILNEACDVMLLFSIFKKALDADTGAYSPLTEIIDKEITKLFNDIDEYETKLYF